MNKIFVILLFIFASALGCLQARAGNADTALLLKPDLVFDGDILHKNWWVLVRADTIAFAGSAASFQEKSIGGVPLKIIELPGKTLLPGFIEGHSHLFLHAYNETSWNDQVLHESRAERTARAVNHARATLLAGFTTVRDLGTEGAGYDDIGLKQSIEKGIIPGPRMLVAGRAIVTTGSYGPRSESADMDLPRGAAEADGLEGLTREIRTQIGKGADVIKLYGDYRWGPNKEAKPTFTQAEMVLAVEVAGSSGRNVVVHAVTPEAMRRAATAGANTIEHGNFGDLETFRFMKEKGTAFCPTLAATESSEKYKGWKKGEHPDPAGVRQRKASFSAALASGVTICFGGDVGVYPHGQNALEMELMVEYGMTVINVLKSATSVNASVFGIAHKVGRVRAGLLADFVLITGNPAEDIGLVRKPAGVMKGGKWIVVP